MKTFLGLLAAITLFAFSASAQYRMVNGTVYLITDPRGPWTSFSSPMRVIGILASGELHLREVFYYKVNDADTHLAGQTWHHAHQDCTFGRDIILKNYPLTSQYTIGDEITGGIIAMRVAGTFTSGSRTVGSGSVSDNAGYAAQAHASVGSETDGVYYDYGIDCQPPKRVLTPAEQAAAAKKKRAQEIKTFRWIFADATNGSVGAQCSLGEHYLNGIGTPTNRAAGIEWLTRAANGGDHHASNVLYRLTHTNSVAVDE